MYVVVNNCYFDNLEFIAKTSRKPLINSYLIKNLLNF